jgi:hypothetical protein
MFKVILPISMLFQFLEANVRLYGIPNKFRTEHHISKIVHMIGQLSDWHRLNPRYFESDLHYVTVKIKIDATKPAIDKIFYSVPQSGTSVLYLSGYIMRRLRGFVHTVLSFFTMLTNVLKELKVFWWKEKIKVLKVLAFG